jgi:hypothetical protein
MQGADPSNQLQVLHACMHGKEPASTRTAALQMMYACMHAAPAGCACCQATGVMQAACQLLCAQQHQEHNKRGWLTVTLTIIHNLAWLVLASSSTCYMWVWLCRQLGCIPVTAHAGYLGSCGPVALVQHRVMMVCAEICMLGVECAWAPRFMVQ